MSINWTAIVNNFSNSDTWRNMRARQKVKISRVEYETFCKEYIFNKLKGESFGNAFCKRFNVTDRTISILKSENFAKQLIESLGYIEEN